MSPKKNRPLGVTIIAIIVALSAILTILGGLALLGLGAWLGLGQGLPGWGALSGIIGIVSIVWGIIGFYIAQGLWGLKKWAWTWSILWLIVDIILSIVGGSTGTILVAGITLIYLYLKKEYFR